MNTEHKDIEKIVPHGEFIRGFANQSFLTNSSLQGILKGRGIFFSFADKEIMVPTLQTLLLSPKEFDTIRDCFNTREDNRKVISREISWANDESLLTPDILEFDLVDFMNKNLPTCKITKQPRLYMVDNNPRHLRADFEIERNDLNKSWYEQKNIFECSIEFIKNKGNKGVVKITHTAPETKLLVEHAVKLKVIEFKRKGLITSEAAVKRILFKDFTNENRIVFFFRLSTHSENEIFKFIDIEDVALKPEDNIKLPEKIEWMTKIKRLMISGQKLDDTFFIKEREYHKHIVIWNIEARFEYSYKGEIGECSFNFGFPDYGTKQNLDSEFEMNISTPIPKNKHLDIKQKGILKNKLLIEMDNQKSEIYNRFNEYLLNKSNT